MANGHGGYRKPTNPAPPGSSGPGKYSRRTDGRQPKMQLPDASYGEQSSFQAAQSGAPMAQVGSGPPGPQRGSQGRPGPNVDTVPFTAPTQNPDQPVTAGAALGAGPGPAALGLGPQQDPMVQIDRQDAQNLVAYLPVLEYWANQPGASGAMRSYVRQIRAIAT